MIAAIIILALVAIGVGWIIGNSTSSSSSGPDLSATVNPTTAQGGHDFVNFACAACHGMQGQGGPDPSVPKLTTVGTTMSQAQIESIIADGIPGQTVPAGSVTGTTGPYMPTWRNVLSKQQISDLAQYIAAGLPAVPGATAQTIPTGQGDVVAGSVAFINYGCENCHGANGLGGVINPSPDGTIPPLGGAAFDAQFPTAKSVTDVITSGSVIGRNPITSMPHWGGIIPQEQLNQLVAYIRTLPGRPGG
jgi:mono/diheme cytochrome c family protein